MFLSPASRASRSYNLLKPFSDLAVSYGHKNPDFPDTNNIAANISTSCYWDTTAPSQSQLLQAERFFNHAPPELLFSATDFRNVNATTVPEVAFLGRSNVGKSSLLNALMEERICYTSSKPGRTRSMNFFAVGGDDGRGSLGKLAVLDMPGYGKGSRQEWGPEIMKYLTERKQLRRAFLLVDALHGLKRSDEEILSQFRQNAIPHQIILSKVDRVLFPEGKPSKAGIRRHFHDLERIFKNMKDHVQPGKGDGPEALGEIITCSGQANLAGKKFGINNVRWAVLVATGLADKKKILVRSDLVVKRRIPIT